MERTRISGIVEAAYQLSVPRLAWLEGLGRSAERALGQGCGTVAGIIDATDPRRARVLDYASTRTIPNLDRVLEETVRNLAPSYVEDSKRAGALLAAEDHGIEQAGLRTWVDAFGARDLLTVLAMDATGYGTIIATNLATPAHAEARHDPHLAQLAAHVLGAYRLRESPVEDAAVFRADGAVIEASAEIQDSGVLDDFKSVVQALDALRAGRDQARALDGFTSRVDATWSVVAHVEGGTSEWIVAKRNLPSILPLPESLSLRERQVMSLVLLGRAQKVVAYELGIAYSTVRVLVSRSLKKLTAKSVEELRSRFVQPPSNPGS